MIFSPENHTDPAQWAAVFAGHVAVGVALAALAVWIGLPVWAAPLAYLLFWELLIQRLGAGLVDALVDAGAVAIGSGTIWAAWINDAPALAGFILAGMVGVAIGIWRRL